MTREEFLKKEQKLNNEHAQLIAERADALKKGTLESLKHAQDLNQQINENIKAHEKLLVTYCETVAVEKQI